MKREKTFQKFFLIIYFLFNVYYSYRYIFKYNSEGTSPTYSNTPMLFQVGKYLLAAIFMAVLFLLLFMSDRKINIGGLELVIVLGFAVAVLKSLLMGSFDFVVKNFIFIIPAYVVTFIKEDDFNKKFLKLNKFLLFFHLAYSLLQIGLYLAVGRLPALAYAGSLVRFGGAWDDPNAFALYLIIPIAYSFCCFMNGSLSKKKRLGCFVLFFVCVVMEIITFSFAGYLALMICGLMIFFKYSNSARLWGIIIFIILTAIFVGVFYYDKILDIITSKNESISQHLEAFILKVTHENYIIGFFFGGEKYAFSENLYNIIFMNFGVLYFLAYILVRLYVVRMAVRVYRNDKNDIFYFVSFLFVSIYTISLVGIPHAIVFPVNFIYWTCAFLTLSRYRKLKCGNNPKV